MSVSLGDIAELRKEGNTPIYWDLNVESIWSMGMARELGPELDVAVSVTSSGDSVRISIALVVQNQIQQ